MSQGLPPEEGGAKVSRTPGPAGDGPVPVSPMSGAVGAGAVVPVALATTLPGAIGPGGAASVVPPPQRLQPSLRIVKGRNAGTRCPLVGEKLTIGRRRADLVLPDPEASSTHAEIVRTGNTFVIRDLKSTNGTFLNGQPVDSSPLRSGDEVSIGQTVMVWEAPDALELPGLSVEIPIESTPTAAAHFSLGIYDGQTSIVSVIGPVEDVVSGFVDLDGTEVLSLEQLGLALSLPPRTVVQLEFLAGPEKGRVVNLTSGSIVIGRYGTDVVVKDGDVSRRHVALDFFGRDQIFIRDLGSTNGCYLNGEREAFARLQSGDTLVLGRTVVQVLVKDVEPGR